MKIFVTTDTHLGHENLQWMGRGRPADFSEQILKNLPKFQGDILIHCGDICIGKDEMWHKEFMNAARKFTKKILVKGNHDNKSDSWYYAHGWDFVCEIFSIRYLGKEILFSHIPMRNSPEFWTPHFPADFNVHGHLHGDYNRHAAKDLYDPDFHKDVCVDDYNYCPVALDKIIK